ncbi:MAG: LysR family transcriptional regulator [Candidatus Pelagibacter sp. TMED64]|nr:LysR family transcriptional regulator [Candidatus Pelagibacter sp.]OUU65754.1 MAG: LysR family transcriptional regulator [Candidatus Pelagibacter sp. TMED64]|tara:strand:- start:2235 stop:3125 length:891 start_codon:yes stop_codon:yes gene_type:complete
MDWDKLKIFHAVASAGSFTKAAYSLNLSQSAISRQIQSLENDLKSQLFIRHARGLSLTENGDYLFNTAHEVISKLKDVETVLSEHKDKPSGKLTVTTVVSFGTTWLTPRIQEFMTLNPEIEVELIFDDKELDLSTRQADIGIWMRRPKQLNYIQRKLIDINYHIYGSTKYLEQYGYPKNVSELNKHKFISYGKGTPSPVFNPIWALKIGMKENKKRKPVMKVNSVYGLLLAVQSGVGLAALPDYITVNVPNIVKILPEVEGPKTQAHFVYPESLKNVARVQAFRKFLYSKVSEWKF